jgi:hypothetical protein
LQSWAKEITVEFIIFKNIISNEHAETAGQERTMPFSKRQACRQEKSGLSINRKTMEQTYEILRRRIIDGP